MTIAYELYREIKKGNVTTFMTSNEKRNLVHLMEQSEKFILPQISDVEQEPWLIEFEEYQLEDIKMPYGRICVEYKTLMDVEGEEKKISVIVCASEVPASKVEFNEDGIVFFTFYKVEGRWAQYPASGFIPKFNITSKFRSNRTGKTAPVMACIELIKSLGGISQEDATTDLGMDVRALLSISVCRMGRKVEYPLAQNAAIRSAMSRKRKMFAHRQLFFSPIPVQREKREPVGTHASPAMHKRRGHFRQLKSGKVVWVKSSIVGKPENGVITKDYVMEGI